MKKNSKIFKIAAASVFAALVLVSSYISIPIPVSIGDVSRIHLGNIFCLLAGLVLGPVGGGLAAGIGSGLYDMLNPVYIASAPFTFVFKFIMAFIAGLICKKMGDQNKKHTGLLIVNILACALGEIAYIILYLAKTFVTGILEGSAAGAMVPALITKLGTSSINAVIAIICAVALYQGIMAALRKSKLVS